MKMKVIATGCAPEERARQYWGVSLLVDDTVLFDTFGDAEAFRANIVRYGVDSWRIRQVVISHDHWDHVAGLQGLLNEHKGITVFCCRDISAQTEDHAISGSSSVVFASDSSSVKTDIWTSGQFECVYDGKPLHEQALVIERPQGLVVVLGCAHPGIKIMLERIRAEFSSPVYMVIGGFHLKDSSTDEIDDVIRYMRLAGIKKLAPTHCTGAAAIELMRKEFKDDLIEVVEGMTFEV